MEVEGGKHLWSPAGSGHPPCCLGRKHQIRNPSSSHRSLASHLAILAVTAGPQSTNNSWNFGSSFLARFWARGVGVFQERYKTALRKNHSRPPGTPRAERMLNPRANCISRKPLPICRPKTSLRKPVPPTLFFSPGHHVDIQIFSAAPFPSRPKASVSAPDAAWP